MCNDLITTEPTDCIHSLEVKMFQNGLVVEVCIKPDCHFIRVHRHQLSVADLNGHPAYHNDTYHGSIVTAPLPTPEEEWQLTSTPGARKGKGGHITRKEVMRIRLDIEMHRRVITNYYYALPGGQGIVNACAARFRILPQTMGVALRRWGVR